MQKESPKHGLLAQANPLVSNMLHELPVTPFNNSYETTKNSFLKT
jgi:hypothetical protein